MLIVAISAPPPAVHITSGERGGMEGLLMDDADGDYSSKKHGEVHDI